MISEKDEQNFSFPTSGHKLVYVKLHINKFHLLFPFDKKYDIILLGRLNDCFDWLDWR